MLQPEQPVSYSSNSYSPFNEDGPQEERFIIKRPELSGKQPTNGGHLEIELPDWMDGLTATASEPQIPPVRPQVSRASSQPGYRPGPTPTIQQPLPETNYRGKGTDSLRHRIGKLFGRNNAD